MDCFVAFARRNEVVDNSHIPHLSRNRGECNSLFLFPPTFVGSRRAKLALGWHIVSSANDVTGGGFGELPPTRRFAPSLPAGGRAVRGMIHYVTVHAR